MWMWPGHGVWEGVLALPGRFRGRGHTYLVSDPDPPCSTGCMFLITIPVHTGGSGSLVPSPSFFWARGALGLEARWSGTLHVVSLFWFRGVLIVLW